jgi:hypothetical protein
MRALRLGLAAIALGFTLSACDTSKSGALAPVKTTPAEVEALVAKLKTEPFRLEAKGAADVAAVRDALPKAVSLTWSALNFDAASGATVLTGVKLTPADMPNVGIGIAELRLWNFNADFAKARLSGQRLLETENLARRIEAKTISIFGIETLMGPAMDAYTGAVENAIETADPSAPDLDMKLDSYEFSIGSIVLDDVMLRPFELKLAQLPADNDFAEVMPMLQTYFAVSRTFAANAVAMSNFKAQFGMTEMGQSMNVNMTAETYGARGLRGSDMDAAFMRNIAFDMKAPMGIADPAAGSVSSAMMIAGGVDYVGMEGTKLDKLARYVAIGEWPPRTETDLLSYGLVNAKNEHFALNGHDIYSVGEVTLDARKWHWFIPAKVSIAANDIVYDVKALMDFVAEVGATSAGPDQAAPATPTIDPAIMQMLVKYGLDKPSLDFAIGWDWNPTSGATTVNTAFGLDKYLRFDLKYDGGMPTFKDVSDLIPGGFETAKGDEIAALFSKTSNLKDVELNVVDEGGLDKIFALTAEIGKTLPSDATGGVAVFANATPESLRQMASAGVYMAADQAAAMMPGAKELIAPFGAFLEKGGKVKLTLKPKTPLPLAATMEKVQKGEITPEQLVLQLNGKTVHTPPGPLKP